VRERLLAFWHLREEHSHRPLETSTCHRRSLDRRCVLLLEAVPEPLTQPSRDVSGARL
jgi:hypothetical protein